MHKYFYRPSQDQPSYLIITVALLKAELFWICSAISCLYKSTKPVPPPHHIQAIPKLVLVSDESESDEDTTQLTEQEHNIALRRLSLPMLILDDGIQRGPSAQDELNGTTCPPVWWQKAKIKLSSVSSHSRSNSFADSLVLEPMEKFVSPISPNRSPGETSDVDHQLTLSYLQPFASRHSTTSSSHSQSSNCSEKKRHRKAKEMMAKLKTKIIKITHHRRSTSLDLDKLKL